jgi:hypothetical protein
MNEVKNKMVQAIATRCKKYPIRCPSLKKMALYVNENLSPDYTAQVDIGESTTGRKYGRLWGSTHTYSGNRIKIKNKKGEIVLDHNSVGTYRYNCEVADFILKLKRDKK